MTMANCTDDHNVYTPFNDTDQPRVERLVLEAEVTEDGMDTSAFDAFRQGVSMRTPHHRFGSTQPKLWSGNPCHNTSVLTYGQTKDFITYTGNRVFEETQKFDPVEFLEDQYYPLPLQFNEGLQQSEEARIEPLTLPSVGLNSTTSRWNVHGVHGSLEDGNSDNLPWGGNTRIEQFIPYDFPTEIDPFLEEGEYYFATAEMMVRVDGYVWEGQRKMEAFNDTEDESIVREQIPSISSEMLDAVLDLDYDLSEDIRGQFGRRSATAGTYSYGPYASRYGTDSIAFNNLIRGA